MDKHRIVVIDTDEEYLNALVEKIIEEWGDSAELEVITSLYYYNEFISKPRNIYILLINEFLFNDKVKKLNSNYNFLLCENRIDPQTDMNMDSKSIYKYSSIKEIYAEILKTIRIKETNRIINNTKVYITYSVNGGCGKTLSSLGICNAICNLGKKVLYINGENLQDFTAFVDTKVDYASSDFGYELAIKGNMVIQKIMKEIIHIGFDCLKPFERSQVSYQIGLDQYLFLLEKIKQLKRYDVIIFEASTEFNYEKLKLFDYSDKIIMICLQNDISAYKLSLFFKNVAYRSDKYLIICNHYEPECKNYFDEYVFDQEFSISEYIGEIDKKLTLNSIDKMKLFQTVGYILE